MALGVHRKKRLNARSCIFIKTSLLSGRYGCFCFSYGGGTTYSLKGCASLIEELYETLRIIQLFKFP